MFFIHGVKLTGFRMMCFLIYLIFVICIRYLFEREKKKMKFIL